ncbi:MAG: hypothetical protein ABSF94_18895 [Steroidobacteraceae bacterium]|jgi:hypothetical protein
MSLCKPKMVDAVMLAFALASGAALADDGVPLKIINDNTSDVIVTVYDLNSVPPRVVVTGERINGFSSVPINVSAGDDGKAHLSWTAVSADRSLHLCGHADRAAIDADTAVHVYAKTVCTPN